MKRTISGSHIDHILQAFILTVLLMCFLAAAAVIPGNASDVFAAGKTLSEEQSGEDQMSGSHAVHRHKWLGWHTAKEPTYLKDGLIFRICSGCGELETARIPRKTGRRMWFSDNDKRYYIGRKGELLRDGWYRIKGSNASSAEKKWCYFSKKGVLLKRLSGRIRSSWTNVGKKKFYFTSSGRPADEGFCRINNSLYLFKEDQSLRTGSFRFDGHTYKTDSGGRVTGVPYYAYTYGSFIFVDISDQILTYYKNGKLRLRCDVITAGNHPGASYTPVGSFRIGYKKTNVMLSGVTHVNYWMAFKGTLFGFHDASWRRDSQFSDHSAHINHGSHGCVNMRNRDAAKLYSLLAVGTRVFIQN